MLLLFFLSLSMLFLLFYFIAFFIVSIVAIVFTLSSCATWICLSRFVFILLFLICLLVFKKCHYLILMTYILYFHCWYKHHFLSLLFISSYLHHHFHFIIFNSTSHWGRIQRMNLRHMVYPYLLIILGKT